MPIIPALPPKTILPVHAPDDTLTQWMSVIHAISPEYITVVMKSDASFSTILENIQAGIATVYDLYASDAIVQKEILTCVLVHYKGDVSKTRVENVFIFYGDATSLHIGEAFNFDYGDGPPEDDDAEERINPPHFYIWEGGYIPYICSANRIRESVRNLITIPVPPPIL